MANKMEHIVVVRFITEEQQTKKIGDRHKCIVIQLYFEAKIIVCGICKCEKISGKSVQLHVRNAHTDKF